MANILLAATKLNLEPLTMDKFTQGLIVTVLGVLLVFLILAFLIILCALLKNLNAYLNTWDAYQTRRRKRKTMIKALKTEIAEAEARAISNSGLEKGSDAFSELKSRIRSESEAKLSEGRAEIDAEYDRVTALVKQERAEIKQLKSEAKANVKNEVSAAKSAGKSRDELKNIKVLAFDALNAGIKAIRARYDALINVSDEIDEETVAVITAAITAMTAEEARANNTRFTIKSIKKN